MSNSKRPWRLELRSTFWEEIERINQLPLNQKHAPILIGTAMEKSGNFELAWDMERNVLFVWATSGTWEYVLKKIVKYDPSREDYYIDDCKKDDFMKKVKNKSKKSYLRSYISSPFENLLKRAKPWLNVPIKNGQFGKWVELSYLLPSYIPLRFGFNFELAHNRDTFALGRIQEYANSARDFFDRRGELIGYGVGDSGLWLDANPIHIPNRSFRLIWGVGGRSDFIFELNDGSSEFWDLKTISPSNSIKRVEELVSLDSVRQVLQQASMQVIYPSPFGLLNVLPVKRVGVLGIGTVDTLGVACHHQLLCNPSKKEPPKKLFERNAGVLERSVSTARQFQWADYVNRPERVELSAKVLREAIYSLIDTLVVSDEWDDIVSALDEYGLRKYGPKFPAPKIT